MIALVGGIFLAMTEKAWKRHETRESGGCVQNGRI